MRTFIFLWTLLSAFTITWAQLAPPTQPPPYMPLAYARIGALTPKGSTFGKKMLISDELPLEWKIYFETKTLFDYPNVLIAGDASLTFNCFGYALDVPGHWVEPPSFETFRGDSSVLHLMSGWGGLSLYAQAVLGSYTSPNPILTLYVGEYAAKYEGGLLIRAKWGMMCSVLSLVNEGPYYPSWIGYYWNQ